MYTPADDDYEIFVDKNTMDNNDDSDDSDDEDLPVEEESEFNIFDDITDDIEE
jgi:hypothetical protein